MLVHYLAKSAKTSCIFHSSTVGLLVPWQNSTSQCLISSIFFDSRLTLVYDSLNLIINAFSSGLLGHGLGERSRQQCSSWTVLHAQCTSSRFHVSQGNAKSLDSWAGKQCIAWFLTFSVTILPKNYRNRIVYVNIIASEKWDVFETQCTTSNVQVVYKLFLIKHMTMSCDRHSSLLIWCYCQVKLAYPVSW